MDKPDRSGRGVSGLTCSLCRGEGGGCDYFGEWDDCCLCGGDGLASPEMEMTWYAMCKAVDDEIDRLIGFEPEIPWPG